MEENLEEIKLKKGELYWLIIKSIGLALVSGGGSPLRPTLPVLIESIAETIKELRKLNVKEEKIRKSLEKLEKREMIELIEKDDKVYVLLRDNGKEKILKYSIKAILDFKKKEKIWDGKWFFVFFDVPEIQRNKRNKLRVFLKQLGFYQYQKSVYIFPYECKKEIALIKRIVEGAKYMKYIIAEKIEDESKFKAVFDLN